MQITLHRHSFLSPPFEMIRKIYHICKNITINWYNLKMKSLNIYDIFIMNQ